MTYSKWKEKSTSTPPKHMLMVSVTHNSVKSSLLLALIRKKKNLMLKTYH